MFDDIGHERRFIYGRLLATPLSVKRESIGPCRESSDITTKRVYPGLRELGSRMRFGVITP